MNVRVYQTRKHHVATQIPLLEPLEREVMVYSFDEAVINGNVYRLGSFTDSSVFE
jgi:hypothetical protein